MARALSERARDLLTCPPGFGAFRRHVEIAEFSRENLKIHLEECLQDKQARAAEMAAALSILHIYGTHPDVTAGLRKASEIWLAAHGIIRLEAKEGLWESKKHCRLLDRFEREITGKGEHLQR